MQQQKQSFYVNIKKVRHLTLKQNNFFAEETCGSLLLIFCQVEERKNNSKTKELMQCNCASTGKDDENTNAARALADFIIPQNFFLAVIVYPMSTMTL